MGNVAPTAVPQSHEEFVGRWYNEENYFRLTKGGHCEWNLVHENTTVFGRGGVTYTSEGISVSACCMSFEADLKRDGNRLRVNRIVMEREQL